VALPKSTASRKSDGLPAKAPFALIQPEVRALLDLVAEELAEEYLRLVTQTPQSEQKPEV
jgi:hypothetical protein